MRLQDKIALITGAGSGIGEATAKTFAREGATVVVVDIDDTNGQRVVEEVPQAGGHAEYTHADIGDPTEIERLITSAMQRFGRLQHPFGKDPRAPFSPSSVYSGTRTNCSRSQRYDSLRENVLT